MRSAPCTVMALIAASFLSPHRALADNDLMRAIVTGGIAVILNEAQKSGPEGGQAAPSANPPSPQRQPSPPVETLPQSEMADLQRMLLQLGYDPGPVDGQAGRRTGGALAQYLTDRGKDPYQTGIRVAQAMLIAEAGDDGSFPDRALAETVAAPDNSAIQADDALPQSANEDVTVPVNPTEKIAMVDGAALLLHGVGPEASAFFGSADAGESYVRTQANFLKLYVLKGDPSRIDQVDKTVYFASIIPADQRDDLVIDRGYAVSTLLEWRGSNQFEIEDSRQAFLARYREQLLTMTLSLPTRITELRALSVGNYDLAAETLEIFHSGSPPSTAWGSYSSHTVLDAPLPLTVPSVWKLPPDEARRIIELYGPKQDATFNEDPFAESPVPMVMALTYEIRNVRKTDSGAAMDLATEGIAIYEDGTLMRKIADLPIPADAIRVVNSNQAIAEPEERAVMPFDGIYSYLWIAKNRPETLDQPEFLAEAFRVRQATERGLSRGLPIYDAGRPRVIPSSMVEAGLQPSAQDLQLIRAWLVEQSEDLPTRVRVADVILSNNGAEQANEVELLYRLQFSDAVSAAQRGRMNTDWVEDAFAVAQSARPDAVRFEVFPSGTGVPTLVSLVPNPAWFGVLMDQEPSGVGDLDLEVRNSEMLMTQNGTRFLLLDVDPVSLSFQSPTGPQTKNLSFEMATSMTDGPALGTHEIAGVRLGLPLADAVVLASEFMGPDVTSVEETTTDDVLGNAVAFRIGDANTGSPDGLVLYYDPTLASKPVIAVARYTKLTDTGDGFLRNTLNVLEERFGRSDGPAKGADNAFYWAVSSVTKAKIAEGLHYDMPCAHNDFEQAYTFDRFRFTTQNATQNCGEMISATIGESLRMLLVNTDLWQGVRDRKEANVAPSAPEPEIKF